MRLGEIEIGRIVEMEGPFIPAAAAVTRRAFFERFAETETVCCMTHDPSPSLFRTKRWGDGFRCEPV